MIRWLLSCLALAGCAGVPPEPAALAPLLDDSAHAPPAQTISADDALAFSPAMRDYLQTEIVPLARIVGPRQALAMALFDRRRLQIDYDGMQTRTAAQAFDDRAGNCLSLVLLTAAFARELKLQVGFQRVENQSSWTRSGSFYAYSEHVNITLGAAGSARRDLGSADTRWTIDFLPPPDIAGQRPVPIHETTVLAMLLNNRAAEALAAGKVDDAYWWARAALLQSPAFGAAYNTLALVHLRHGDAMRGEAALRAALQRDERNPRVLANLVDLLARQGRLAEAQPLRERLVRVEPVAPFQDFEQGLTAMRDARWADARDLFRRELARDPDYHEFHFWLAQAEWRLGHDEVARRHLERALQGSPTRREHDLYAAKLDRLTALH
jgi:Tfp pilus assembly protein PilF